MKTATPIPNQCSLDHVPAAGQMVDCSACGRTCDARMVRLCRVNGPGMQTKQPQQAHAKPSCCGQNADVHEANFVNKKVKRPSFVKRIKTVTTAAARFIGDGLKTRSESEQAANLAVCNACPLLKNNTCEGCGCDVRAKVQLRLEECPAGKWFPDLLPIKPLIDPVRHMLHCCLPVESSEMWRWNLDELAKRQSVFNGRHVLAIIHEPSGEDIEHRIRRKINGEQLKTVDPQEVIDYCTQIGLRIDEYRVFENVPKLGEVVAFQWLLESVESLAENEVAFYSHSKGVTRSEPDLKRWPGRMYRVCLDDVATVDRALERASFAGCFIREVPHGRSSWHPSGTFGWYRSKDLYSRKTWRNVEQQYYGTEAYFGTQFKRHEAICLSHDKAGNVYADADWATVVRPQEAIWEAAREPLPVSATIIITCGPRYDRWVRDAIQSALEQDGQPEIVVVFDKCEPIPDIDPRIKVLTVDHGAVQLARKDGIAISSGKVLFFLDADNAYAGTRFIVDAVDQLTAATQADPSIAGISVNIDYFDEHWQPHEHEPLITPEWDRGRFERLNFLDTCTPVWRHAMAASWHQTVANGSHEDHHAWRQLARDGWTFAKGHGLTLRYRICPDSSSSRKGQGSYATRYGFHDQPVTIFVPLSGRSWAWPAMRDWLDTLARSERGKTVRLMLADTSGDDSFSETIRRDTALMPFSDVRYYRQSVASPGLADMDRTRHERAVQIACSRIYNRLAQEVTTHLVLVIEDDILPQQSGEQTLRTLIDGLTHEVAAVSGVYRDRRHGKVNSWTAYDPPNRITHVTDGELSRHEYREIAGSGFGCLLIRREVLQSVPHALPDGSSWYDPRFFSVVKSSGLKVMLARDATCDHFSKPTPGGERVFSIDWFTRGIDQWDQHALPLAGQPLQLLEVGSYEGRSACWMADNLMSHPQSRLTCVDGGIGLGSTQQVQRLRDNLDTLANRDQIDLRIGSSFAVLPSLTLNIYDLIYIDGSHLGGDTIRDLCNAWPLLRAGGLMFIDDYQFKEQGVEPREWAGPAVDYWLALRGDEVDVLHVGWQVIVRRR